MKKRILFSVCVLSLIALFLAASPGFAAQDFPKPVGLVNDFARVLPQDYQSEITGILESLRQSNGVEIAVVTVYGTEPLDTNSYAFSLFRAWGIGDAKSDNGILLLVNVKAREIRIEVGTGLEGYVNDAKAGRILDLAKPDLAGDRYGPGLLLISRELAEAVAEAPGTGKTGGGFSSTEEPFRMALVVVLVLVLFSVFFRGGGLPFLFLGGGGRSGGGGGFGGFGGGRSSGGGAGRRF